MRNSNPNTDAFADGYRFRLELFGTAAMRLTPEFARTKSEATRRRKHLVESGIQARVFKITEDGGLCFA
jgi:hypothetical protein